MPAETVLIADDDDIVARIEATVLGRHGYRVLRARNGTETVEMAQREQPAAILLDLHLGADSGLDVCRRLRAEGSASAILLVTGDVTPAVKNDCAAAGADDFVPKPFVSQALLSRVEKAIRARTPASGTPRP